MDAVDAVLAAKSASAEEETWTLSVQGGPVLARFQTTGVETGLEKFEVGCRVEVAGICTGQLDPAGAEIMAIPKLRSVELLVSGPGSVPMFVSAPYLTAKRLFVIATTTTCSALLAGLWIYVLRRTVRIQTGIIRRKIEHETLLEKRTRIGRDLHDAFEQELGAIHFQVDTALDKCAPEQTAPRSILMLIKRMVKHVRSEAGKAVWSLRANFHGVQTLCESLYSLRASLKSSL